MPNRAETTVRVRIVRNDVNARDTCNVVYRNVVISYSTTVFLREIDSDTYIMSFFPDFVDDVSCKSFREIFLIETCIGISNHIQKDAETCIVTIYMLPTGPILRTKTPGVLIMLSVVPLWCAIVFQVKTNQVNTNCSLLHL